MHGNYVEVDSVRIKELYDQGLSCSQIANVMNISSDKARSELKRMNVTLRSSYIPLDASTIKELYVENGMTSKMIAKQFGVSQCKILSELKNLGVQPRRNYKHIEPELLRSLYVDKRMTTHQIAAELGVSQRQIYLKVKDLGIIRSNSTSRKGVLKTAYGSRRPTSDGYYALFMPDHPNATSNGYVLEHRYVMSQVLGRPLLDTEVVHHVNEDRRDNRPENLMVYSSPGVHVSTEHRPAKPKEQMLKELRELHMRIGRPIKQMDIRPYNGVSTAHTYNDRFGSWRTACELAGVPIYSAKGRPRGW